MGRFHPNSKTCCHCKNTKKDLELKDRIYHRLSCGVSLDRDKNAAINIKMVRAATIGLDLISRLLMTSLLVEIPVFLKSLGFSHG